LSTVVRRITLQIIIPLAPPGRPSASGIQGMRDRKPPTPTMITAKIASPRTAMRTTALIALGCAFSLALAATPALNAAAPETLQPLADKAPSLPVKSAFEKVKGGESGPYVLKLTNASKDTLKVTTKILLAVAFHANDKARNLPEHAIDAGQTWSVPDLAAGDKLVITAKGFASLELTVP